MLFLTTAAVAQNTALVTIYNQIPPIPDALVCENAGASRKTIALIDSLSVRLETMRLHLNEALKNNGDRTYTAVSAGFPTEEELKKVETLSEAEQQAFWEKIEAAQIQSENAIARNTMKYQAEKETLNYKVADYHNALLAISEELSEIYSAAMKVHSDKRLHIYDTCRDNDSLTAYGRQQMTAIDAEFCAAVSPAFLKKLRFEYSSLKQNISMHRRLICIELAEFSTLTEKEVCEQNVALLDLTELELIVQCINSYKNVFSVLPQFNR